VTSQYYKSSSVITFPIERAKRAEIVAMLALVAHVGFLSFSIVTILLGTLARTTMLRPDCFYCVNRARAHFAAVRKSQGHFCPRKTATSSD